MPSAGLLPFLHSSFCSFGNTCNRQPTTGDEKQFLFNPAYNGTDGNKNESIIVDAIYYSSLQLRWIGEHPIEFQRMSNAFARMIHLIANLGTNHPGIVQLKDLFVPQKLNKFHQLLISKEISERTAKKLENAWLRAGIFEAVNSTYQKYIDDGLFGMLLDDGLPMFCQENLFNQSFYFSPGSEMSESERSELCTKIDIMSLGYDFAPLISDASLPSNDNSERVTFGELQNLMKLIRQQPMMTFYDKYSNVTWQDAMLSLFCGQDPREVVESMIDPNNQNRVETPFEKLRLNVIRFIEKVSPASTTHKNGTCGTVPIHPGLNCSSLEGSLFSKIRPAMEGYILVSPRNDATQKLINQLNEPLRMLEYIRNILFYYPQEANGLQNSFHNSDLWKASRNILKWVNATQPHYYSIERLRFALEHIFASSTDPNSFGNVTARLIANANLYTPCFLIDRFRFVDNETEMEKTATCLMAEDQFFTGIVFNMTNETIDFNDFTSYKIRHFPEFIDSTSGLMDSKSRPFSRHLPLRDLKYITFGFSFLQEAIDRAIIGQKSGNRSQLGTYAQQEPFPCVTKDTFNVSLFMPLFLLISFILPSAILVKNIVYEKELRIKEQMRIMGLGDAVHFISWAIVSLVLNFLSVLVISAVLKVARIFNNTDYSLLLLILILFMFSAIAMSLFFSTFFTNANISTASTCVLWFLFIYPFQLKNDSIKTPTFTKISLVLPPTAMGYAFQLLAAFNEVEEATWADISKIYNPVYDISLIRCMVMLGLDTIIFVILSWYISAVAPGVYGVKQPFYFPFLLRYWFPNWNKNRVEYIDNQEFDTIPTNDNFDAEPQGAKLTVHIKALSKVYGSGTKALNNLHLRLYESQITALLGHNGAGKTTTMSILCGLYSPSSGSATVYGRDLRNEIRRVRDVLGVCPQHNVLFTHLTVAEQLRLFAALKGVKDEHLDKEVHEVLESVSLIEKANKLANTLSGGMKRRLCIGIALIGGSKLVILDEPTAGVDVTARKEIWKLLQKNKQGRTILLSTHHMDEADVLSDRIAILSEGELLTLGTSVFLKRKFGESLTLAICKKKIGENYREKVEKINEIPNFSFISHTETDEEIVFKIPIMTDSVLLEHFFTLLDRKLDELELGQYGISAPTLQQIFVSLAPQREYRVPKQKRWSTLRNAWARIFRRPEPEDVETTDLIEEQNAIANNENVNNLNDVEEKFEDFERPSLLSGFPLFFSHVKALLSCRTSYSLRSKRVLLFQVIVPLLLLCACETYVKIQVPVRSDLMITQPILPLETAVFGNETDSYISTWDHSPQSESTRLIHSFFDSPGLGTRCSDGEPNQQLRGARGCQAENGTYDYTRNVSMVPYNEDIYCTCEGYGWNCTMEDWKWTTTPWFQLNTTDRIFEMNGRNLSQMIMVTRNQRYKNFSAPYFVGGWSLGHTNLRAQSNEQIESAKSGWRLFLNGLNITASILSINISGIEPTEPRIIDQFSMNITKEQVIDAVLSNLDVKENVKVWFNNKIWPSFPIYSSALTNAILRSQNSQIDPSKLGILTMNSPMNETVEDSLTASSMNFAQQLALFRITCLMLVLSMIPAGFTVYLVEDRICDAFHLQLVGGLKKKTYWATSYFFDMIVYTSAIFLILFMFVLFAVNEFAQTAATFFSFLLVFWLYGLCAVLYAYCMQQKFTVPALSFVFIAIGTYFVGIVCSLTVILIENLMQQDPTLVPVHNLCTIIFLIIPQYNLGLAIFRGVMVYQVKLIGTNFLASISRLDMASQLPLPNLLEFDVMGKHCIALTIHVIIADLILTFCQLDSFAFTRKREVNRTRKLMEYEKSEEDVDVKFEKDRVYSICAGDTNNVLVVRNLAKAYTSDMLAVRGVSFAVASGECFGLLGLNGAGKSTTFGMLTGKITPGDGSIELNGASVTSGDKSGYQQLGYTPQFDALNMKLTTRENLVFYARIRGIPEKEIAPIADRLLRALHLRPYSTTTTGSLSGGNRRKLSVAVALISQPSLVFLDEPSAGMDPGSQQFLWKVIERLCASGKAVVLTSHSMEECEALCSRIAIMDKGKIRCIGGKQHLKNKFGKGYSLTMKMSSPTEATATAEFMCKHVPASQLDAIHCSTIFVRIDPEKSKIADILKTVNEAKLRYTIEDFTLSQSTLDEVFQSLSENEWNLARGHARSTVSTMVSTVPEMNGSESVNH